MDLPPFLLPRESINQSIALIFKSFFLMELIHQLFRRVVCQQEHRNNKKEIPTDQLLKTSVQLTHIVVNCTLALSGIYYWYGASRPRWEDTSFFDRWTGFQDLTFFGCIMISYNVWSSYASWVRVIILWL